MYVYHYMDNASVSMTGDKSMQRSGTDAIRVHHAEQC